MLLIGAKIQEYRKNAGFSQEEFAAKIGVTRQAVSKWELDKAYPDLDKLVSICDIFQISITELIYGTVVPASEESAAGKGMEAGGLSAGGIEAGGQPAGGIEAGGQPAGGIEAGGQPAGDVEAGGRPAGGVEAGRRLAGGVEAGRRPAETGMEADERSAGKTGGTDGASAGAALEISMMSAGKARGRGAVLRLCGMLVLLGALLLFCGVMLVTTLFHHAWKKDDALIEQARVERVYQQYTKADISFYDDVSRKVLKTVWIDVDGIREGDFIACYTDEGQQRIYYEYHARTPVVLAVITGGFLVLFLLCLAELRRLARENGWHIWIDEAKETGRT